MRRSAVRKYALIVIASAVVPMVLVGVLYDRYARSLLVEFTGERVDARLVATASRIGAFLEARTNQLGKLARHPSAWALRLEDPGHSGEMVDLVRLEADHPDLYGILVFSPDGALAEAYMGQAASGPPYLGGPFATDGLARARLGDAEVLGPVPPAEGRSGWFLIRQPLEGGGTIALHVRLASLTELIGPATEADVLTPILRTPAGDFDGVGRPATIQGSLVLGPEVLPGWRPGLVVKPDEIVRPFQDARVALLVATLVAGAAIALLARRFNRMAARLGRLVERTVRMKRQAALGQFSTGVAHEVRNPLAALKTTVQAMARLERDPERAALLADMEREIDRMSRAMAAILTFGRPRPPERTAVSLDGEARSVLALVAPDAGRREVELVRGELPGGAARVDPDHLRQILLNLFANALHATPAGGRVTLRGRARGAAVELEVEDTGEGIPEDRLAQVFEPFFTTKRAGTGLGLSISRQLAEMNGGALVLRSVVGAGTCAVLSLPREGPHVDDPDHR